GPGRARRRRGRLGGASRRGPPGGPAREPRRGAGRARGWDPRGAAGARCTGALVCPAAARRCGAGPGAGAGQAPAAPRLAPVRAGRGRQHCPGAARLLGRAGVAPRGGGAAGPGSARTRAASRSAAVPGRGAPDRGGPGGRAPAQPLAGRVRRGGRGSCRDAACAGRPGAPAGDRCAEPRLASRVGGCWKPARMTGAALPLRDVHMRRPPSWWPPAPGWWMLAAVAMVLFLGWAAWRWHKARRRRLAGRLFDQAVAAAATPAAQVAAISALLRRAARRVEPGADALDGDAWLAFLDRGLAQDPFRHGPGALLRDGAFRPEVDAQAVQALRVPARARFIDWMLRR